MAKTATRKKGPRNRPGTYSHTELLALIAAASNDPHQAHTGNTVLELTADRSVRRIRLHPSPGFHIFATTRDPSPEERRDLAWPETILIELGKPLKLDPNRASPPTNTSTP